MSNLVKPKVAKFIKYKPHGGQIVYYPWEALK